jgi:hypothetical protein
VLVAVITTTGFVPLGASVTTEGSRADATGTEDPMQAHHDLTEERPTPGSDRAPHVEAPLLDAPSTNDDEAAFQAAQLAIEHRQDLAGDMLPDETAPLLDQQHRNLDLAETLTAGSDPADDDRATAIATAQHASPWQATTLDLDTADPVPLTGYTTPSQALLELANRHNATPTSQQLDELQGLDDLEDPVRSALARTVDAFLALDTATQLAYADADRQALEELRDDDLGSIQDPSAIPASLNANPSEMPAPPSPGERLAEAGVNLAPVLETRAQFLDAVHNLQIALDEAGIATAQACEPVQVAPAFSIGLTACDDTYTTDVALQLDAGGTDTYHNNAGGSNLAGGSCRLLAPGLYATAALVDLGTGDEAYGNTDAPRECGTNGGGALGVGFLLDEGGNDIYTADSYGTNGGGYLGVGLLLDAAGDDTYTADRYGTNGGGRLGGVGLLHDAGGNDTYTAGSGGTNGGGDEGVGFLLDQAGNDTYNANRSGTNGGGNGGVGFLVDEGGDDTYTADSFGTNGGSDEGVGFLHDAAGNDTYTADSYGTNGGGLAGVGFLHDAGGNDTYTADSYGTNGGGQAGVGLLLDAAGDDTYTAGRYGTNGGGRLGGAGLLLDEAGNDTYTAGDRGTNGGGDEGVGLLLDAAGTDRYEDPAVPDGSCQDCTLVPKGTLGAQVDSDDA